MSWSYDLAESLYNAFNECDVLPVCAVIWPGCTPPYDIQHGNCPSTLWITFEEGAVSDRRDVSGCVPPRNVVTLKVWIKQCVPQYDSAGTLPPADEIHAQARDQASLRNRLQTVFTNWASAQTQSACPSWTYTPGMWVCASAGECSVRTLTFVFQR